MTLRDDINPVGFVIFPVGSDMPAGVRDLYHIAIAGGNYIALVSTYISPAKKSKMLKLLFRKNVKKVAD